MGYGPKTEPARSAVKTRVETFIAQRRCFTFACHTSAKWIVHRHDGVEVPKCNGCLKAYSGKSHRPIAETQ